MNKLSPKINLDTGVYQILRYSIMGFVVLISLGPLLWVLLSSFQTSQEILSSALNLPENPSFKGYATAFKYGKILGKFSTSMIVASITTVLAVFFYALAAYVLARFEFRLRVVIFSLLISSILIPGNALIQPIFKLINLLGLYNTKGALILTYTALSMPLCLFLLRSFMLNLPYEMEESAYLEGASFPRTFWSIILPLSKPALMSSAVLTFLGCWHDLLFALLLTSSERNRTLPMAMKYFVQQFTFDYSAMFAALVLYMVPAIIIYIFLQEQIVSGLVGSALKE